MHPVKEMQQNPFIKILAVTKNCNGSISSTKGDDC